MGIILAALVPRLTLGPRTRAKEASARAQVVLFSAAIEAFKVDNGDYPSGTHALASLFRLPANAPHWHGPYLKVENGIPVDPWGKAYLYKYPGYHNADSFDIMSAGPDEHFGTDDDIGNWPRP